MLMRVRANGDMLVYSFVFAAMGVLLEKNSNDELAERIKRLPRNHLISAFLTMSM